MTIQKVEQMFRSGGRVFPLAIRLKNFPEDAVSAYAALRKQNPGRSAFFETADGEQFRTIEQTILGFSPIEVLQVSDREVLADPIKALRAQIESVRIAHLPEVTGFQGGYLGHLAYDVVRYFEPSLRAKGYFREHAGAADPDVDLVLYRHFVVLDHKHRIATAIALLDLRELPAHELHRLPDLIENALQDLRKFAGTIETVVAPFETQLPRVSFAATPPTAPFTEKVKVLKEHIRNGDIFQAVLSDREEVGYEGDPLQTFAVLRRDSPAPYRFYFDCGTRVLLGASPEKLVSVKQGVVETHPIAGTRPRGLTAVDDHRLAQQLKNSRKEAAEHLMLVDLARNDIGRVSEAGTVRVPALRHLVKYAAVQHLVSKVEGRLKSGLSAFDALIAAFPAGTLSGAPKIRAMEILSELETQRRGFYGGAVVALGLNGELDSCIAIRSLEVRDGKAILRAGAGIVADSQPVKEAEEVQHKLASLKKALRQEVV